MVELFPFIPILNPYGSHTVMGGQHWNHRGPISVSHGSHLGPNYVSRKYHFSRIISILSRGSHILECIFIVIKFYQYGTYKGLIWAKKPIWGPSRTQMRYRPRICPYGSHIYVFAGQSLPIWDLYRSYMGKKSLYGAHAGPEWDKCPDSAHMGPIYTCLLGGHFILHFITYFNEI